MDYNREIRLIVLFIAATLALHYPLLSLYDRLLLPFGIPLLYLYLFGVWLVIIVLTAVFMKRPDHSAQDDDSAGK